MQHRRLIAVPLVMIAEVSGAAPGEGSQRLVDSPLSSANLVETALGLAFVLGVMLALAWLVRRFVQVPGVGKGQVQVLGGVSLGARERAVLVAVEGRRLLVGIAPGQVRTLLVLGDEPATPAFAETLEQARLHPQAGDAGGGA